MTKKETYARCPNKFGIFGCTCLITFLVMLPLYLITTKLQISGFLENKIIIIRSNIFAVKIERKNHTLCYKMKNARHFQLLTAILRSAFGERWRDPSVFLVRLHQTSKRLFGRSLRKLFVRLRFSGHSSLSGIHPQCKSKISL